MKQFPYSDQIKRELFTSRLERRAKAAFEFIALMAVFACIGVLLAWRG